MEEIAFVDLCCCQALPSGGATSSLKNGEMAMNINGRLLRVSRTACLSTATSALKPQYNPRPHSLRQRKTESTVVLPAVSTEDTQAFLAKLWGAPESPFDSAVAQQMMTHKSFDHGKQGYNEKLAFIGRRVLYHHLALYIASRPSSSQSAIEGKDIEVLTRDILRRTMEVKYSLGPLAVSLGIVPVMRWKPARESSLSQSGDAKVAAECLQAIVGASEMVRGGAFAKDFVDRTILPKLKIYDHNL